MTNNNILNINNLHANIDNTPIIQGVNLSVNLGEVHAIMGKNGSGKSTLAKVIAGHPSYTIKQGEIIFNGEKINDDDPEHRSHKGLFLGFQYPVEIPGVSNADFLRLAYNSQRRAKQQNELDPLAFFDLIGQKTKFIDMDATFLTRNVNEGFSGGEKKKNEILQMALLESKLSILDETDSGLDIDALKTISNRINELRKDDNAIILITHYQRLLNYIVPDYIHIMHNGKIVHTGDANLAKKLEEYGYDYIT
uniref:iron-sulfur cluster formation ABC transporter ATP-binding subunit n=1 Tax=Pachymeniopsis lanceolata TaxID=151733 RepID=UPI002A82EFFD|nr:iron-sulfur cluster formation ABC transporter ATP-binding subunit [Pachymeniopsis lanceolata]WOL37320.1 iron-sulfur cluster formation ABC transporter ATP-binding subunit [Pachymeniopsis lanceolata]